MAKASIPKDPSTIPVMLKCLLLSAERFRGDKSLADIIDPDLLDHLEDTGLLAALDKMQAKDLDQTSELFDAARVKLTEVLRRLSTRDLEVAIERVFSEGTRSRTLDQLGSQFEITRERIRQIQNSIERKVAASLGEEVRTLALLAKLEIGPLVDASEFEKRIEELFQVDGPDYNSDRTRRLIKSEMRYRLRHGVRIAAPAISVIDELSVSARDNCDQVGLVDEEQLKTTVSDTTWLDHWLLLTQAAGMSRLSGHLALRTTGVARVKAVLLNLGRPATVEEISAAADMKADKLLRTVITNNSYFVRADKKHWYLKEKVNTVYHGISSMIRQRIERDGGTTSLSRLIEELPEEYGVKKISVTAYARTMQYEIDGDNISLADPQNIKLRPLDEVIEGRDSRGYPYWSFKVQPQYFKGYSILGVPAEIAMELGCKPNDKIMLKVATPPDCRDMSLIWRLDSTTGASIGYFRDPLTKLNFQVGDTVFLVLLPNGEVDVRKFVY